MAKNPFYDSTEWKEFRAGQMKARRICEVPGCKSPSRALDHIKPIRQGGAPLDPKNTQALCWPHHSSKTAACDGGFGNARSDRPLIVRGADEQGLPLDPRHHWYQHKGDGS